MSPLLSKYTTRTFLRHRQILFSGLAVFAGLLFSIPVLAEDKPEYATKNIPAALLPHANYVVRHYSMSINIFSRQDVLIKEHYVVTVLNSKGDEEADHNEYASALKSIEHMSGYIYDANGAEVQKIKRADFKEVPASMRAGEFSDAKFRVYRVQYRQYPYTVEYNIETRNNHTFHFPEWQPQPDNEGSVEFSEFTVSVPDSIHLKYRQFHVSDSPVVSRQEHTQYKWSIKGVSASKDEPLAYTGTYTTPTVILAIDNFMLDDYTGSTASWADFGTFIYQLNKGRDNLPADAKADVQKMVAGAGNDRERINILYRYLQKTMRYVSITYGIGGWQTLDADFLSRNQYGDCKALSNYMMTMLEAVGVTSYPVLISAGRDEHRDLSKDFVCSQFNHCILCVPSARDTVWLECTSTDLPVNYLSNFTQNRDALMITPAGGVLVHTPVYDTSVNLVTHHATVTSQDGKLLVDMTNIYSGEAAEVLYRALTHNNDHDKDEYLQSKFHLPSYKLNDYKYTKIDATPVTSVREDARLTASNMCTKTGDRTFVQLDVAPISISTSEEEDGPRKSPFYFPTSRAVSDTIEFAIPAQTDVEFLPPPVTERHAFGSFSYVINKEPGKLVLLRRFTLNGGTYDAALYESYVKFISTINKQSRQKVVLKGKA